MRVVSIDIETYSDEDIKRTGAYRYALSPNFEVLLIGYAVDDGPVKVIDMNHFNIDDLETFLDLLHAQDTVLKAWNAAFESWCLNIWLHRWVSVVIPEKSEQVPINKWRCDMIHALYCGYPGSLKACGEAIGLEQDQKKMSIGTRLISLFCKPQTPTKKNPDRTRVYPHYEPEKWALFIEYNRQDVETERYIENKLKAFPVPDREWELWWLDITQNRYGVGIDMDLVNGAIDINARNTNSLISEARAITGLDNPNSVSQLIEWLSELGVKRDTLRKADVGELLDTDLPESVRRVLEIRQQLGKTSCKKYDAIRDCVCRDGRVRGVSQFYGAHTGRYCGRLIQTQNLPQNHLEDLAGARTAVERADSELLAFLYGEDKLPDTLSQLIRTALVPKKGNVFVIADYSAIECRVIAWLSGEQWVLDAFRDGKDIYCETASGMFGVPVSKHGENSHLRQRGKVATLACGYGGGTGALEAMGAVKMGIPPEDLPDILARWRKANPHICAYWRACDEAINDCMTYGEAKMPHGIVFRYEQDLPNKQSYMTIELPSGRKLFYNNPHFAPARNFPDRQSLHYYGMNQVTHKWLPIETFGGRMSENLCQSVARDLLCDALMNLYKSGFTPVFHVHDEIIFEAPKEKADECLELLLGIMATPPAWADGLPLKGAGFTAEFYQKD